MSKCSNLNDSLTLKKLTHKESRYEKTKSPEAEWRSGDFDLMGEWPI